MTYLQMETERSPRSDLRRKEDLTRLQRLEILSALTRRNSCASRRKPGKPLGESGFFMSFDPPREGMSVCCREAKANLAWAADLSQEEARQQNSHGRSRICRISTNWLGRNVRCLLSRMQMISAARGDSACVCSVWNFREAAASSERDLRSSSVRSRASPILLTNSSPEGGSFFPHSRADRYDGCTRIRAASSFCRTLRIWRSCRKRIEKVVIAFLD